jgi:hypothetical protein
MFTSLHTDIPVTFDVFEVFKSNEFCTVIAMIKILSFTSFYSIKELPFVSSNERNRNAITIARNVHSADNSSIEPAVLQGMKV